MRTKFPLLLVLLSLTLVLLLAGCQGSTAENPTPTSQPAASATQTLVSPAAPTPSPQAAAPSTASPTTPVEPPSGSTESAPTALPTQAEPESTASSPTAPPQATPTSTSLSPEAESGAEGCDDLAGFYGDLSIPDDTFFTQDSAFTKSWRIKNEGTCTWDAGYAVIFHSGDPLSAPLTSPLPASVPPGSTVDISLEMRAPDAGGTYYSNWELQNSNGERFGLGKARKDFFWAQIAVGFLSPGEPVAGAPEGSPGSGGAASGSVGASGACAYTSTPGYAQQAIQLINQARLANGLPALVENPLLDAAAQTHSIDMACNNHSSHTGTDGSSWPDRIAAQGYSAALALENVYAGDPAFGGTPQGAVDWWLGSPVHLGNILNPNVTEIGVGYAASDNAQYIGRFTAVFARP